MCKEVRDDNYDRIQPHVIYDRTGELIASEAHRDHSAIFLGDHPNHWEINSSSDRHLEHCIHLEK